MTISTINQKVDKLGNAWEEFKKLNDRRLQEIEHKGSSDVLTVEHLNRIGSALDGYKSRLDSLETAYNRPEFSSADYNQNATAEVIAEHKNAFLNYIRKGVEGDLAFLEQKALSNGSDVDGGYLVTPKLYENMAQKIFETSPMRQLASVMTMSTDTFDVIQDMDTPGVGWSASETAVVSESTTPQISKVSIDAYEVVAQPKATQKLIDDATIDIEQWMTEKLVDAFSRLENTAFVSGDGSGKPKGILSYTAGTGAGQIEQILSGTSAVVTADGLIKLYYALKDEYARKATFLMNRATVQAVRLLKDTTNQYIWNPGLAVGTPDTLMGVPVMLATDIPVPAAASLSVAVGDFKRAYQIVDRHGVRILRDPYTEKPFVKFYTTKRVGGQVVNFEAVKILKLS